MSVVAPGDHVWADFGDGKVLAHVVKGAHTNDAGETKYGVQNPQGTVVSLTYREPEDRDEAGSGMTFWLLK